MRYCYDVSFVNADPNCKFFSGMTPEGGRTGLLELTYAAVCASTVSYSSGADSPRTSGGAAGQLAMFAASNTPITASTVLLTDGLTGS